MIEGKTLGRYLCLWFMGMGSLGAAELRVHLNEPVYVDGALTTDQGGVIEGEGMRLQACSFAYTQKRELHKVIAEGNVLFMLDGRFFVGDQVSYDFVTKTGVVTNGVCCIDGIYACGKRIILLPDKRIHIEEAYATTSDCCNFSWSVGARTADIDCDYQLKAEGVTFRIYDTPLFYFPSYSMALRDKPKEDSIANYSLLWEKGQGPLFIMRYRVLDSYGFKAYWRLEGRVRTVDQHLRVGGGTAFELDYQAPDKMQTLATRNFYAYDTFYNDLDPNKFRSRYRVQGQYSGKGRHQPIETFAQWDWLSDKNMRSDFPTQLFELSTLERTEAFIKARYDAAFISLYGRPRINTFRGFKQELPTFKTAIKPYEIGSTGFIIENYLKLAYLDYVYANNLEGLVPNFRSSRFETKQLLYRPIQAGPVNITPAIGFDGIYYGSSHTGKSAGQAVMEYNLTANSIWQRFYTQSRHLIEPYLEFKGLTSPTVSSNSVYIFSIEDGFHELNQLKLGLKNAWYSIAKPLSPPIFTCDVFAYNFFGASTFTRPFPKSYLDCTFNADRLSFTTNLAYNFEKNTMDHIKFLLAFTFNEYFSFNFELRRRGLYEWKKCDPFNFILDVAQPIDSLRYSPLEDRHNTFFARWQVQLTPLWFFQAQNHVGWNAFFQPLYHESKYSLFTTISNTWLLRLSYMHTVRTNEFTFGVTLI